MSGQLPMFPPETLSDTSNATSSPGSAGGATRSDLPDGPTIVLYGQVPARVSRSRRQVGVKANKTAVISGLFGKLLYASVLLQKSLANKLVERLGCHGSTLYVMDWKVLATPLRRRICALRASAPRISGKGFSSLPTVTARDWRHGMSPELLERRKLHPRGVNLNEFMQRALGRRGLINPALACSMMGYPLDWLRAASAVSAMPSSHKSQRRS